MYFTHFLSFPSFGHLSRHLPRASTPFRFYSSVFSHTHTKKNSLASARHLKAGSSFGNSPWSPTGLCGSCQGPIIQVNLKPRTLASGMTTHRYGHNRGRCGHGLLAIFILCLILFQSLSAFVLKISLQEYLSHPTPFSASQS